jgi:DNA-binding transcriptional ArsR family regulator
MVYQVEPMSILAKDGTVGDTDGGTIEISDVATLRAVADPLRMRLLGVLESGDRTVKELAAALDLRPNRLYYHVRLLEEHGLIRVASTRTVSGNIERRYELAARRISVAKDLATAGGAEAVGQLGDMVGTAFDEIRREFVASIKEGDPSQAGRPRRLSGHRLRVPTAKAEEFMARLDALIAEYEVGAGVSPDPKTDAVLTIALYPQRPEGR